MTVVLKEIQAVSQLLLQGGPDFKGRALLSYGFSNDTHGVVKIFVPTNSGAMGWGGRDETDAVACGFGYDITRIGSLETGGSNLSSPGETDFYRVSSSSIATRRESLDFYGCGEIGIDVDLGGSEYNGLFVMGGTTLQTKVGSGSFTGTGPNSITGVGFRPDLVLMGVSGHTFYGSQNANVHPFNMSYGACDADLNQFACSIGSHYLSGTSGRNSRSINDGCFLQVRPSLMKGTLTSMDADGFTIDVNTYSGAQLFWWMALKDVNGQFSVGTMESNDSSFSPGFEPEAVMLASSQNTAWDTNQLGGTISLGGMSPDEECSGWLSGRAGNLRTCSYWNTSALAVTDGLDVKAEAFMSSWGSTIGLNWVGSYAGRKIGWVAMKTSHGPGFDGCGGSPQQIYRWLHR